MAKADEIMEVLTQEISGFNKSVEKLEMVAQRLEGSRNNTDNSGLEFLIQNFLRNQKKITVDLEERMADMKTKIDKSRLMPKWEVIMLYVVVALNSIVFGYLGYYYINFEERERIAYQKGREEAFDKTRAYFEEHPIIKKDFKRWIVKRDSLYYSE